MKDSLIQKATSGWKVSRGEGDRSIGAKGRASGNGEERQRWRNGEGKDRASRTEGSESLDVPRGALPGAGFLEGKGGRVSARALSYQPGGACSA